MTVSESTSLAPSQRTNEDDKQLLERFDPARRSYVANTFLYAVRAGARTPLQVMAAVNEALRETLARSLRWPNLSATVDRTSKMFDVLSEHHDEAMAFARWALAWEALPQAERDRQKAAKGAEYRQAYMEQQPPSDKQIAYIRTLGYTGEVTSKAHASELIERLKRGERVEVNS